MIRFRSLCSDDFPTMLAWLQHSHVKEWWNDGDNTVEKLATHYSMDTENTMRFIVELDGEDAGYFQYYRFSSSHTGTDQFLANEADLSRGIGTKCLLTFIDMITDIESPNTISVDPHPANKRSIRCYEKCGFIYQPSRSNSTTYYMAKSC